MVILPIIDFFFKGTYLTYAFLLSFVFILLFNILKGVKR